MDKPGDRTGSNRGGASNDAANRLKYAVDAGFFADECSDSDSCDDDDSMISESARLADLSASFRIFSESLLRKELAELEMVRSREALRCEAEKRRMESENELTRMLVQTQLQIASFVAGTTSPSRKRKRGEGDDESHVSQRERALLLSLLQCNFIL